MALKKIYDVKFKKIIKKRLYKSPENFYTSK